jgi:hypothetical protein
MISLNTCAAVRNFNIPTLPLSSTPVNILISESQTSFEMLHFMPRELEKFEYGTFSSPGLV